MPEFKVNFIERVPDEGQWFDRGTRVGFVQAGCPGRRHLEPAALGSYEVLRCARLEADGTRWLAVTLRPFGFP
jgi:hypothetical protein